MICECPGAEMIPYWCLNLILWNTVHLVNLGDEKKLSV